MISVAVEILSVTVVLCFSAFAYLIFIVEAFQVECSVLVYIVLQYLLLDIASGCVFQSCCSGDSFVLATIA